MKGYRSIPSGIVLMLYTLVFLFSALSHAQRFKVIANQSTGIKSLDHTMLEDLFLGKIKRLNGKPIVIILYRRHKIQKSLAKSVANKSENRFLTHWKKMVFTGKAIMPRYAGDVTSMVEYVKATPGAVGFVPAEYTIDLPKVLTVKTTAGMSTAKR
ncbi:hypothetical protein BVY04_04055 [bacterium M21]|nr:hypothetical protein BVY04_04055 [bacterium M21]